MKTYVRWLGRTGMGYCKRERGIYNYKFIRN